MSAAAITTLVIVALIVAALAFYLTWVAVLLVSVHRSLGTTLDNLRAVAERTAPIGDILGGVRDQLTTVALAVEGLLAKVRGRERTPSA